MSIRVPGLQDDENLEEYYKGVSTNHRDLIDYLE